MSEQIKKHPFTFTLGEGPFRFVGTFDLGAAIRHQEAFGDSRMAFASAPKLERGMGTCAHCNHAILNICIIQRGDGLLYGVGSDCVSKAAAEGDVGALAEMERSLRNAARDKRRAREQAKCAELRPAFESALNKLSALPHPTAYYAEQGKTLADYYSYVARDSKSMQGAIKRAAGIAA